MNTVVVLLDDFLGFLSKGNFNDGLFIIITINLPYNTAGHFSLNFQIVFLSLHSYSIFLDIFSQ